MGNLFIETTPLPHDLKVTMQRFTMVYPIEKTERRSMFLSNIDQAVNFNVETIHFFRANGDFPPEKVVELIENALRKLLVPYDFLAGRLKFDPTKGRLEVDCNSAGAGFAVAKSELSLAELGSLVYPNTAFRQLIQDQYLLDTDVSNQPAFVLQVTSFKCGGFTMSISNNHTLMDGLSFKIFLQNLASLASGKPLAITPYNDRTLLAARSPPRVTFPHPELLELPQGADQNAKLFQSTPENLDIKVFHVTADDITKLREKAKTDAQGEDFANLKITSFNVIMAHIWQCKALSLGGGGGKGEDHDRDRISTILYAVDVRSRLGPPTFPATYTGNAVVTAYGSARVRDVEEKPFCYLVSKISEGTSRVSDEYVRSVIDWGELHKGFPYGDVLVSSWWRLGFDEMEYPWGRAYYCCPLVHHRKDIILLFPDIEGGKSVNVLVALPSADMKKFQQIFTGFLG